MSQACFLGYDSGGEHVAREIPTKILAALKKLGTKIQRGLAELEGMRGMNAVQRLDMVCELIMGQAPDGIAYNTNGDGWPLIAGAGDFGDGIPAPSKFTREASKLSKAGDIVLGIRASIGKKVLADRVYCLGRGVAALRAKPPVDSRFLWHWLTHATPELATKARGATFKQVSREDIGELEISYPPLLEQRRIAAILDQAEALRTKRRNSISKLDALNKAHFHELVGDPTSNPHQWPIEDLETFFQFRTGKLDSNAAVPLGDYPFFTCSREDFRINTFAFDCEALLLAGNNASADYSVKHYKGKFNAYQRTYVITLKNEKYSYQYARFVLEQRLAEMKRISKGSNTKYLTLELLNRIQIPVPPANLQRKFAIGVEAVKEVMETHLRSLSKLDALFASLQHQAFRGEL